MQYLGDGETATLVNVLYSQRQAFSIKKQAEEAVQKKEKEKANEEAARRLRDQAGRNEAKLLRHQKRVRKRGPANGGGRRVPTGMLTPVRRRRGGRNVSSRQEEEGEPNEESTVVPEALQAIRNEFLSFVQSDSEAEDGEERRKERIMLALSSPLDTHPENDQAEERQFRIKKKKKKKKSTKESKRFEGGEVEKSNKRKQAQESKEKKKSESGEVKKSKKSKKRKQPETPVEKDRKRKKSKDGGEVVVKSEGVE
jgi:hypothetical protein